MSKSHTGKAGSGRYEELFNILLRVLRSQHVPGEKSRRSTDERRKARGIASITAPKLARTIAKEWPRAVKLRDSYPSPSRKVNAFTLEVPWGRIFNEFKIYGPVPGGKAERLTNDAKKLKDEGASLPYGLLILGLVAADEPEPDQKIEEAVRIDGMPWWVFNFSDDVVEEGLGSCPDIGMNQKRIRCARLYWFVKR